MKLNHLSRSLTARLNWPLAMAAFLVSGCGPEQSGSVVNYETKRPIPNAKILHAGKIIRTDARGEFAFRNLDKTQPVLIKAAGFRPKQCAVPEEKRPRLELEPLETRGLYLSYAALGQPETRSQALGLLDGERLNTLAIDIKDRQGRMTFYNGAPCAGQVGAFGAVKFDDIQAFLKEMHRKHIYVVGRIAVFKDPLLAKHNPEWAVRAGGRPNNFWLDPYRKEVWTYNLSVVKEAASMGFDEIELDCVWFPGEGELRDAKYSRHDSPGNRTGAIAGFLSEASQTLAPYNVCLSLSPSMVPRWEGGRSGRGLGPLTQSTEYLGASIRNLGDLARVKTATAAEARQWRAYIECAANSPKEPFPTSEEVKAMATACRAAGLSGWILSDARGQYNLTQEFIRALTPDDR
jgi:hypothetical protein